MRLVYQKNTSFTSMVTSVLLLTVIFYSCNITRKAPKDKPYLYKNSYEVNGGNFSKLERSALLDRLANQIDDSSKLRYSSPIFFINILKRPPAYDTGYSALSAANMKASMYHLGYYNSIVTYKADTTRKSGDEIVKVHYTVEAGKPLLIDTFTYQLYDTTLQAITMRYKDQSVVVPNNPITKAAVQGEIARLIDTFRNNGYYKITSSELRMIGDTTIEALTNLSDDPFEQLELLRIAQQKIDSPVIKLALIINKPEDSSRLSQYRVSKVYILQDYRPNDHLNDTSSITQRATRNFILRYHEPLFKTGFLSRNISFRPGELYRQRDFNQTLNNLSKTGVWQSTNLLIRELKDSNLVDIIVELAPEKKFGFEASVEASYSASSNTNNALAGNLIGFSGNLSLVNRNIGREAIRMTHRLRAGVELNNNSRGAQTSLINSNEIGYSNNIVYPRDIFGDIFKKITDVVINKKVDSQRIRRNVSYKPGESFINSSVSINNRLGLFNLQTIGINAGVTFPSKKNTAINITTWTVKPLNIEYNYLYNKTDSFQTIIDKNPFLRYSYNTSFVIGFGAGYSNVYRNPKHLKSLSKERLIRFNGEESGLTWGWLPVLNNDKNKFIKLDGEYKYTVARKKTALVFRAFAGVGIPILGDSALPFFKQFFGGGSNSMRGWPIRGVGRGSQPLADFRENIFNDRTGDIQFEMNGEYRYDIAPIIRNLLILRGAVFVDIGNVWNIRNTKLDGSIDSARFQLKNFYRDIGLSAGTGFRLDFNYVVLRFDLGFRFKRPELAYENNGWKAPEIGFDDFFKKIFARGNDDQYRRWRYENFNFTIGISYPF